jgi:flagellar protein FliS
MSADLRARYLNQRVMTATPGQRVVMLYDRLALDLVRAADCYSANDALTAGTHIDHAMQIVAELAGSLDTTAGGPAENLASLYGYLLRELSTVLSGETARLAGAQGIIGTLRDAWSKAVTSTATPAAAGAWVG